jgi:hypothetical protein
MKLNICEDDPTLAIFSHDIHLTPDVVNYLIHKKITKVEFSKEFNNSIDALPDTITEIKFDSNGRFSQPINKFPNNLQKIDLPLIFNNSLDMLPQSLTDLSFHAFSRFNKPLNNLPLNLTKLCVTEYFNQSLDILPQSLRTLTIFGQYNLPLDNLPQNLEKFTLICDNYGHPLKNLPDSIREITINFCNKNIIFPKKLKKLRIPEYYFENTFNCLPQQLETLGIFCLIQSMMDTHFFPQSLKYLSVEIETNILPRDMILPKSLETITLSSYRHAEEFRELYPNIELDIC